MVDFLLEEGVCGAGQEVVDDVVKGSGVEIVEVGLVHAVEVNGADADDGGAGDVVDVVVVEGELDVDEQVVGVVDVEGSGDGVGEVVVGEAEQGEELAVEARVAGLSDVAEYDVAVVQALSGFVVGIIERDEAEGGDLAVDFHETCGC